MNRGHINVLHIVIMLFLAAALLAALEAILLVRNGSPVSFGRLARTQAARLQLAISAYHDMHGVYIPDTVPDRSCTPRFQSSECLHYYLALENRGGSGELTAIMECDRRELSDKDGDGFPESSDPWGGLFEYAENSSHSKPTGHNMTRFDIVSPGPDGRLGGTISSETGYVRADTTMGREQEMDNCGNVEPFR